MGAKFEATQASLVPVLEEIKARGLLYVDDGSVQGLDRLPQIAGTIGLDYSVAERPDRWRRHRRPISPRQLAQLEATAKERGAAIGVVQRQARHHQADLAEWAGKLQGKGIVLVPGQRRGALAAAKLILLS